MKWKEFWEAITLLTVVLILAFANRALFGTPVNTFLLCTILFGLIYNDLAGG